MNTSEVKSLILQENLRQGNIAIHDILLSGLDFIGNAFDVTIEIEDKITENWTADRDNILKSEKNLLKKLKAEKVIYLTDDYDKQFYHFSSRATAINIPVFRPNTHELKIGQSTIQKVSSSFNMECQAQMSIRMDTDFYIYDLINIVSGLNDIGVNDKLEFTMNFKNIKPHSIIKMLKTNRKKVNIYVSMRNLYKDANIGDTSRDELRGFRDDGDFYNLYDSGFTIGRMHTANDNALLNTQDPVLVQIAKNPTGQLPYFVFEDVKFIGFGNSVDFDRDGQAPLISQLDFIFKRLRRIEPNVPMLHNDEQLSMLDNDNDDSNLPANGSDSENDLKDFTENLQEQEPEVSDTEKEENDKADFDEDIPASEPTIPLSEQAFNEVARLNELFSKIDDGYNLTADEFNEAHIIMQTRGDTPNEDGYYTYPTPDGRYVIF